MSVRLILIVLCIAIVAGLWQNVWLVRERRELRHELATMRGEPPLESEEENPPTAREIEKLTRALHEETALLQAAQATIIAAEKATPRVEDEELRSLGYVEQMGREAAEFLPQLVEVATLMKGGQFSKLSEAEQSRLAAKMMAWVNRVSALGDLEEDAPKIARFHATSLRERLHLDDVATEQVRRQAEREFAHLKAQGLARPQRPENDREEWYRRRKLALDEATARIEALIPASQRQPYAVGQSLHFGTGLRTSSQMKADGHGSVSMSLDLPGFDR